MLIHRGRNIYIHCAPFHFLRTFFLLLKLRSENSLTHMRYILNNETPCTAKDYWLALSKQLSGVFWLCLWAVHGRFLLAPIPSSLLHQSFHLSVAASQMHRSWFGQKERFAGSIIFTALWSDVPKLGPFQDPVCFLCAHICFLLLSAHQLLVQMGKCIPLKTQPSQFPC